MKKFKDLIELTKPKNLAKIKSRMADVKTVDSRDTSWRLPIEKFMKENGFSKLGSGKYASVFGNPNYNFVVKVFLKDAAFLRWYEFIKANQSNPYVPKIRGKIMKLSDLIFGMRIEKLTSFNGGGKFMDEYRKWKSDNKYRSGDKNIDSILDHFDKNSKLLDLHGDNMMMRGKQDVVIDPYYNWFDVTTKKYTIDPDKISPDTFK